MKIITDILTLDELKQMAAALFENSVKTVVDVDRELIGEDFIEFDSLINMRPSQGNRSRGIDNEEIRKKIIEIVAEKIKR